MIRTLLALFLIYLCSPLARPEPPAAVVSSDNGTDQRIAQLVRVRETTADFSTVFQQVDRFADKHGIEHVLLVVDLDNTLLAMNQDLGSDQWFNWQEELLAVDPHHPALVAQSLDGLLAVQGILFSLSAMHPPEPSLPSVLKERMQRGLNTAILTSRGKAFRDATLRELQRNGYELTVRPLTIREQRGPFPPYERDRPEMHGLNAKIIDSLGTPRKVTYSENLYLTAGQHKGYLLKTLLSRLTGTSEDKPYGEFKAIVFVDDRQKHTDRMQSAFAEDPIDLATFRYSRQDGSVARFERSSKDHVIRDWNLLQQFIKTVLVK